MEILIILLPLIMEMLQQCREDRTRDDIEHGLRRPGIRELIMLRRAAKKEYGYKGKKLRKVTRKAMNELYDADPEEITVIMDEVETRVVVKD